MIQVAQSGKSCFRKGQNDFRCLKFISRIKTVNELLAVDAHEKTSLIILVKFYFRKEIPGINQSCAIALAVIFAGILAAQHHERILLVRGTSAS